MRNEKSIRVFLAPGKTIGKFGKVRLVKKADGTHEIIGGTVDQRTTVRQWCDRFANFLVFAETVTHEIALAA